MDFSMEHKNCPEVVYQSILPLAFMFTLLGFLQALSLFIKISRL